MQMHNPSKGFTSLFWFFSFMLISIGLTTGSICSDTAGNFTTNSTYDQNRNLVLSSFASKVVLNDGFFYTTSIGQEPDKVYGLALCRRDSSSEQCTRCITTAIASIMDNCPNKKEAIAWGGDPQCIIRYANRNIFGKMETDPMAGCGNKNSITANMTQFNQTWERLMDGLARKASSESYDSSRKFATGEASLTYLVKIYALMQCTPDISESYCDYCLRQSLRYCEDQFAGKPGGCLVMRPSCMYLWGLSPFYEAFPADSTSPSPPQSNNFTKIIKGKGGIASETLKIIFVSVVIFLALAALVHVLLQRRKTKSTMIKEEIKKDQGTEDDDEILPAESLQFDFNTIKTATNNFSIDNKLGQGGFGVVYKGRLPDGQDIAVKRLSRNFGQGETEFKNEVLLVARLQHRNLVRLIGFCLEGNERLLIYEFVVNSSLDSFIFDSIKCLLLNWETRLKIIEGIARGLMYLHEDSRLRIIHRDLKASNILLDVNMIPKISDFGMARLFETDQSQAITNRIVGTLGYMAPEYVKHGHFSVKSDVFSFGVLVLEIISGQKNTSFPHKEEAQDLLTYAWRNWKEGKTSNLIDPILRVGYNSSEMMRCIHIGLLCVQENVANRPTMASVVLMLTSFSLSLPLPSKPAFYINSNTTLIHSEVRMVDQYKNHVHFSLNEASISQLEPR